MISASDSSELKAPRPQRGSEPPPLEIHDLTVAYHKKPVLYGIDVMVPAGKLVGIIGPNGAGKSTLIKAAMGLLPIGGGWVKIFGEPFRETLSCRLRAATRISGLGFSGHVMDVVLMGRYGHLGLVRRPTSSTVDCARLPRQGEDDPVREPPDLQSFRGPAAARLPRPRAGAGERSLLHG